MEVRCKHTTADAARTYAHSDVGEFILNFHGYVGASLDVLSGRRNQQKGGSEEVIVNDVECGSRRSILGGIEAQSSAESEL